MLESSLRPALERREFRSRYPPKVDLITGQIIGTESVIRWNHPEAGILLPSEFIPIAEEMGLTIPIGGWVLRTACAQNKAWQRAGLPPVRMAVNISAKQFQRQTLVGTMTDRLNESGLHPNIWSRSGRRAPS